MSEQNKFLTEAMGECWHEWNNERLSLFKCSVCGKLQRGAQSSTMSHGPNPFGAPPPNNFSTWDGFGKLWTWAQGQEWWGGFIALAHKKTPHKMHEEHLWLKPVIDPPTFATAVYEFLKGRES